MEFEIFSSFFVIYVQIQKESSWLNDTDIFLNVFIKRDKIKN